MGELAIFNKDEIKTIGQIDFLRKNLETQKIVDIRDINHIKNHVTMFVMELELHFAPDKKTEKLIIQDIEQMILSVFKTLSIHELYFASRLKRYGKIGGQNKSYGRITTEFVSQILMDYKNWKRETQRNNNLPMSKSLVKPSITEDEKNKLIISGMKKCFDYYESDQKILEGYVLFFYDVLFDDGLLPTDKDSKNKTLESARRFYEGLKNSKADSLKSHNQIKEARIELAKKTSTVLITKAKEITVLKFLAVIYRDPKKVKELKSKYTE